MTDEKNTMPDEFLVIHGGASMDGYAKTDESREAQPMFSVICLGDPSNLYQLISTYINL